MGAFTALALIHFAISSSGSTYDGMQYLRATIAKQRAAVT